MDETDAERSRMAKVLDHPVRRRIIELLGSRGPLSWKELSSEVGVGTGALYYHIDTLEGIVSKDKAKKYALTKPGKEIFEYLQGNPRADRTGKDIPELKSYGRVRTLAGAILWPRALLQTLCGTPTRAALTTAALSAVYLSAIVYLGESVKLFFPSPSTGAAFDAVTYLITLGSLFLISYSGSRLLSEETSGFPTLATASALSLAPVLTFASAVYFLQTGTGLVPDTDLFTAALVFFQSWGACILGAGISLASGARIERALLVSLFVLYASMAVAFFQGSIA